MRVDVASTSKFGAPASTDTQPLVSSTRSAFFLSRAGVPFRGNRRMQKLSVTNCSIFLFIYVNNERFSQRVTRLAQLNAALECSVKSSRELACPLESLPRLKLSSSKVPINHA